MFFYHVVTFQLRQHFYTEHAVIFTPSSHFSERLHFYTEHEWPSPQHCMRIHSDACIHDQFLITAILHHTYIRNQIHTWIQSHYKQLYICSCWYLIKLVRWVFYLICQVNGPFVSHVSRGSVLKLPHITFQAPACLVIFIGEITVFSKSQYMTSGPKLIFFY